MILPQALANPIQHMAKSSGAAASAKSSAASAKAAAQPPVSPTKMEPALMELFISELKDIYWAENQLVKALPKMQQSATTPALADAIANHWEQTKGHVTRLDKIFGMLCEQPRAKKCDAMEGLNKEAEAVLEETEAGTATRDVGIIIASQKVEHYEIAAYGSLAQLARTLGLNDAVAILEQTLAEEKDSDRLLTEIAESGINYEASSED
jgi:ferritin-like metal-binding protein YciE